MKTAIGAALLACVLVGAPAQAAQFPMLKLTGGRFLSLCTDPPRDHAAEVVAMCQVYIAGIADGLQTSRLACFGPRMTQEKLFATSMWWLDSRPREGFPAGLMIRNGLVKAFPCQMRRPVYAATPEQKMERFEKVVDFLSATKTLLVLFGLK